MEERDDDDIMLKMIRVMVTSMTTMPRGMMMTIMNKGDDWDDNHHVVDKDDDCADNYHRSILCITHPAFSQLLLWRVSETVSRVLSDEATRWLTVNRM